MTVERDSKTSDGGGKTERTGKPSRWIKRTGPQIQLALTGFVLIIVASVLVNNQLSKKMGGHFTPMLDGVLHIKQAITTSHLWLEEHLATNNTEGLQEVLSQMEQAESDAASVIGGNSVHILELVGRPEGELKTQWQILYEKIKSLKKITKLRIERPATSELRTEVGRKYDETIRDTMSFANQLENTLENRITDNMARLHQIQFLLIGVCLLLLGAGAWFINNNVRQLAQEVHRRRLTEKQLKRSRAEAVVARDQAQAASAMKDQLLGKVGHEVRTPVNAILGLAAVIESTQLDAKQRKYLRMLESETRGLSQIMEDLSDFTKLESAKLSIRTKPTDLRRVVADAVDLVVPGADAKGITLDADLPVEFPPKLMGDCVRIRQIVLNLLDNAIKFTDRGQVVAGLSANQTDDGRYDATLWVEDTGIGVPHDKGEHIFRPFAQADDSMARRFGGTGLGLAICTELVALMHGTIGFENIEGGGARFWCSLPLEPAEAGAEALSLEPLADYRVLVVDIDDEVRQRTCRLLQQLGAVPVPIDSAARVPDLLLESLENGQAIRAVLVNDRLSETTVRHLTAQIRNTEPIADTDVFVLVRNSTRVDADGDHRNGVTAFLASPYRALELPSLLLGLAPPRPAMPCAVDDSEVVYNLEVLLVEDHPVTQIAGRYMLENLGCRVDSAHNGHDALEQWRAKRYDVIFLDWQMPGMDGLEVAAQIRTREQNIVRPRSYLVAMTANAMAGDRERCLNAGMDEYISKPVTRESFIRALSCFAPDYHTA